MASTASAPAAVPAEPPVVPAAVTKPDSAKAHDNTVDTAAVVVDAASTDQAALAVSSDVDAAQAADAADAAVEVDGVAAGGQEGQLPVFFVTVRTPAGDEVVLHNISAWDTGSVLRQLLCETQEACAFTAYQLEVVASGAGEEALAAARAREPSDDNSGLDFAPISQGMTGGGVVLNEFRELGSYGDLLTSGATVAMVPTLYSEESVRFHVRRVRDMLLNPRAPHARSPEVAAAVEAQRADAQQQLDRNRMAMLTTEQVSAIAEEEAAKQSAQEEAADGSAAGGEGDDAATNGAANGDAAAAAKPGRVQRALKYHKKFQRELTKHVAEHVVPVTGRVTDLLRSPCADRYAQMVKEAVVGAGGKPPAPSSGGFLPQCVRRISYSGWNPPSPLRRLAGDVMYLEIVTLEQQTLHVTASARGFYVNRSRGDHFNAMPSHRACFSHSLVDLLCDVSALFKRNYTTLLRFARELTTNPDPAADEMSPPEILAAASGRADVGTAPHFGGVSEAVDWVVPAPTATATDGARNEDYLDEVHTQSAEQQSRMRDWNDEYQLVLDLPQTNRHDMVLRARAIYRTQTGFVEAAVAAAIEVVKGNVMALNSSDPPQSRVYMYNHIFLSVAYSDDDDSEVSRQEGEVCEPERLSHVERAHLRINHDVAMLKLINGLDIPELRTVLTVIVDFMGQRLVAQTIIPGILQSAEVAHVAYGSPDHGRHVQADPRVHAIMQKLAPELHLAERVVQPSADKADALAQAEAEAAAAAGADAGAADGAAAAASAAAAAGATASAAAEADAAAKSFATMNTKPVSLVGPVECKIIVGSDNRTYILDMERFTPVDYNFVDPEKPYASKNRRFLLRPELINLVVRAETVMAAKRRKVSEMAEVVAARREAASAAATAAADASDEAGGDAETKTPTEPAKAGAGAGAGAGASADAGVEVDSGSDSDAQAGAGAEAGAGGEAGAQDDAPIDVRFNVNAFTPFCAGQDPEQLAKDEEKIKELAKVLVDRAIPSFVMDLLVSRILATDGATLVRDMHAQGINVRYLGYLAELVSAQRGSTEQSPRLVALLESEMVVRACKRLFRRMMRDPLVRAAPAAAIVALLNCVLGAADASDAGSAAREPTSPGRTHGRGGRGGARKRRGNGRGGSRAATASSGAAAGAARDNGSSELGAEWSAVPGLPSPMRLVERVAGFKLTREAVWEEITAVVKRKFKYKLQLWANGGYGADGKSQPQVSRSAALRRLCQKLGLRLAARDFDFAAVAPFNSSDIVDVVPVIKHSLPASPIAVANRYHDAARRHLASGALEAAENMARTAQSMLYQVAGTGHHEMARMYTTLALIMHRMSRYHDAVHMQRKATELCERVCGLDDSRTVDAYSTLAELLQAAGDVDGALVHRNRALQVADVAQGRGAFSVTEYLKMSNLYTRVQHHAAAIRCLRYALALATEMRDWRLEAECRHHLAVALAQVHQVGDALVHLRAACDLLKRHFGEDHPRTAACRFMLRKLTARSVSIAQGQEQLQERAREAAQVSGTDAAAAAKAAKAKKRRGKRRARR